MHNLNCSINCLICLFGNMQFIHLNTVPMSGVREVWDNPKPSSFDFGFIICISRHMMMRSAVNPGKNWGRFYLGEGTTPLTASPGPLQDRSGSLEMIRRPSDYEASAIPSKRNLYGIYLGNWNSTLRLSGNTLRLAENCFEISYFA